MFYFYHLDTAYNISTRSRQQRKLKEISWHRYRTDSLPSSTTSQTNHVRTLLFSKKFSDFLLETEKLYWYCIIVSKCNFSVFTLRQRRVFMQEIQICIKAVGTAATKEYVLKHEYTLIQVLWCHRKTAKIIKKILSKKRDVGCAAEWAGLQRRNLSHESTSSSTRI